MTVEQFLEKWAPSSIPFNQAKRLVMKADLEEMLKEAKKLGYPGAIISEDDSHA